MSCELSRHAIESSGQILQNKLNDDGASRSGDSRSRREPFVGVPRPSSEVRTHLALGERRASESLEGERRRR